MKLIDKVTVLPVMKTTLNKIRDKSPCENGWKKLLTHLGKTKADDEPLAITTILDGNGLDDALWCLQAVTNHDREIRLYAVWCARQVQHLMTDPRSIWALDVAERFANGSATQAELNAAVADAWDASRWGGRSGDAAVAAAMGAAWDAAVAAAMGAAWDAAGAAAWDAAWNAEVAAVRAAQEAELRRVCEGVSV